MNFLLLTAHDYRSRRRASIHFIADELKALGSVHFCSIRFSYLSALTADPRWELRGSSNQVEEFRGVDCYLWRAFIHPVALRTKWLTWLESIMFKAYVALMPAVMKNWIRNADTIIFESGISPVFLRAVKIINPSARTVYSVSDDLQTIGAARYARDILARDVHLFDVIRIPSEHMRAEFTTSKSVRIIPHGFSDTPRGQTKSPYPDDTINGVSVGSMLFDPDFFRIASDLRPDIWFHVIGCGQPRPDGMPPNVFWYDEMPYEETIPYLQNADFGIAPYKSPVPKYLADTSLKLMQFDNFRLASVCPPEACGNYPWRVSYQIDKPTSLGDAIDSAIAFERGSISRTFLTWGDVVSRMLAPMPSS